jgi:ubiquinone/menaquinone biosynthesis C-methylase UbiE
VIENILQVSRLDPNILEGIIIGEHKMVTAGSVITKHVLPYTIVGGNSARYIKTIHTNSNSSTPEITSKEGSRYEYNNRVKIINESSWGINTQPQRMEAIKTYATHGDQILDLGSGRGAYIKPLSKMGYKVIGLDINYYPEWRTTGNENFVVGTGTRLPFSDKSFDTTISFEVLEHIPDLDRAIKEIARCTKERFIFSVPNCDVNNKLRKYDLAMAHWTDPTHCNFFTKDSLAAFLLDNHFKIVKMMDCYKVSPNEYYWNTVKLPRRFANLIKTLIDKFKLAESYWSSILVVAEIPKEFSYE